MARTCLFIHRNPYLELDSILKSFHRPASTKKRTALLIYMPASSGKLPYSVVSLVTNIFLCPKYIDTSVLSPLNQIQESPMSKNKYRSLMFNTIRVTDFHARIGQIRRLARAERTNPVDAPPGLEFSFIDRNSSTLFFAARDYTFEFCKTT